MQAHVLSELPDSIFTQRHSEAARCLMQLYQQCTGVQIRGGERRDNFSVLQNLWQGVFLCTGPDENHGEGELNS